MSENSIGLLVKKAKGEDRSLREYARDSGVDVSVISKIINGNYIPKKPDVYRALTSSKASPRDGVTYQQLIEAANSSKSYQKGVIAGMGVAQTALLSSVVGLPLGFVGLPLGIVGLGASAVTLALKSAAEKGDLTIPKEIENGYQRFVATSNGLIFSALSINGVIFHIVDNKDDNKDNCIETYLRIDNQSLKEYGFKYAFFTEEQLKLEDSVEKISLAHIAELVFLEPKRDRKVSIVTNSRYSYDYLVSYKNKLSYDGTLSVILVDLENVSIVCEEFLSYYHDDSLDDALCLV